MGHYTGEKSTPISTCWNNSAYFQILKFHNKVADVMIKPSIQNRQRTYDYSADQLKRYHF